MKSLYTRAVEIVAIVTTDKPPFMYRGEEP
jgi:hypothetical protein